MTGAIGGNQERVSHALIGQLWSCSQDNATVLKGNGEEQGFRSVAWSFPPPSNDQLRFQGKWNLSLYGKSEEGWTFLQSGIKIIT